jgi:hypothetical protein
MAKLTRHVGRLSNSGVRCAVVFRSLPDEPDNCLVIETDALSDMLQDDLMKIVEGKVSQEEVDLYKALERSQLTGGANALTYMHQAGHIKKVPISNVEMIPFPNRPVPLADINAQIDGTTPVEEVVTASTQTEADVTAQEAPANAGTDEGKAQAASLIRQAEMMEDDAAKKREAAYQLDPSLKPTKTKTKAKTKAETKTTQKKDKRVKSEAEKQATREARNERRRQAYAAKKASETDAKIEAQIAEKVVRDAERVDAE